MKSRVSSKFYNNFKVRKLIMCKKCYAFYYKSVWHFEAPGFVRNEIVGDEEVPVRLIECPSCIEQDVALNERDNDLVTQGLVEASL